MVQFLRKIFHKAFAILKWQSTVSGSELSLTASSNWSKPNSNYIFWFQRDVGKSIIIPFKNFVVVFNFENNMSICTIHILIARTICYTRLLSPLLLLRPLLQFTHCSLASQKYQILECLYFSLQTILLNFQKTRRDKSLMWPKGCSSVKVWWSGTLQRWSHGAISTSKAKFDSNVEILIHSISKTKFVRVQFEFECWLKH